jgi:hypothetical protein
MWCVVLLAKGDVKNGLIPATLKGIPEPANMINILKRATLPELIGTYKYNDMTLYLFGYKSGRAGTENKHDLPPPHDKVLLFGEAVVCAVKDGQPVNFDTKAWPIFYEKAFGGFEELGEEDTASENSEDEEEGDESDTEDALEEEAEEEIDTELAEGEEEEEETFKKIRVPKVKRGVKKLPTWFNNPELQAEAYEL